MLTFNVFKPNQNVISLLKQNNIPVEETRTIDLNNDWLFHDREKADKKNNGEGRVMMYFDLIWKNFKKLQDYI